MDILLFLHVLFMVLWLGTAAGEIILELVLWRTKSATVQRAYIELHRLIDAVLEGPALVLTLITGLLLLWKQGYFIETTKWPKWLEDKLICTAVVMGMNLLCIGFVFLRAKSAERVLKNSPPLEHSRVKVWHLAIASTFIGVPFALAALWFALNKGKV